MAEVLIKKIAIVGGTHGNELTGINLVKYWQKQNEEIRFSSFETQLLLANKNAIHKCTRYTETDLNRCFRTSDLQNPDLQLYEQKRAKEINEELGEKGSEKAPDLILDVHNSTANMGVSIIFSRLDEYMRTILAKLQHMPNVYLYYMPEQQESSPYLPSISPRDICVEAGAQAHGTLDAGLYFQTKEVVLQILKDTEAFNQNKLPANSEPLTVYRQYKNLDFPRNDEGEVCGMIHPDRQFMDYKEIQKGEPLFITFEGDTIFYEEDQKVCPVFINENAYYEKKLALSLTIRETI